VGTFLEAAAPAPVQGRHLRRRFFQAAALALQPHPLPVSPPEPGQVVDPVLPAGGDAVQFGLHGGGEVEVDELGQILLQQAHHGERRPRRHERLAAMVDVAAGARPVSSWKVTPSALPFFRPERIERLPALGMAGGVGAGLHYIAINLVASSFGVSTGRTDRLGQWRLTDTGR